MSSEMSRRRMVQLTTLAGGAVGVGGSVMLSGCAGAEEEVAEPSTVSAAEVPVGSGTVVDDRYVVVQPTEGEFYAYTAVCPHQGCLVQTVTEEEIICPCHSSRFSPTTGEPLSGPVDSGLAEAKVEQSGEELTISMG
ncbi:Rieske (2Fe-2S) protein [Brevibacterium otitidis]|uniref:Cytochrome bc1 complex Rieske iron-sulfur subunit n=1 Tax=Brevibacterium otitidis TaxID=53364 RepID=A0ABV5X5L0_9MICO|nr:hypothetical protein GCM10023233_33670 [Brevibacterium otitidis]